MRKLPESWPEELKRELSTPIATEDLLEIERSRKVALLARYYIDFDQFARWKKQGKHISRELLWMQLVHRLLADLFPGGFHVRKRKGRGPDVRTVANDSVLVYRVQAIRGRRKITESAAVGVVYRSNRVYQQDKESTLLTRYKIAKSRPEVVNAVNLMRDLERGEPFESDYPGYGKAFANDILTRILTLPSIE